MKKLLLLIVPLLLLFGVSFADTFEFSSIAGVVNYSNSNNSNFYFTIFGYTGSSINLHSIYLYDDASYNDDCLGWILYQYNSSTILKRGDVSIPFSGETIIDYDLSPGVYIIRFVSTTGGTSSCSPGILSNSPDLYFSGFFAILGDTKSNVYNGASMHGSHGPIDKWVFSGTNPMLPSPSPITIWYNGTGMTFAGSNIYLTDLFHNYTMSGSDIIFTPYVYRALFRSH